MELSIVIVNWNTKDLLQKCLDSVYANPPGGNFEIWVVDNASTDGSVNMVETEFPQVRLIQNDINKGFASANNQAIRKSEGQYVLLLNSDTEVLPGALPTLAGFLEQSPETGAAGARLLNADRTLQRSCYPTYTLFREFWRLFHLDSVFPFAVYPMEAWDVHQPREVDALMGACLLLRRETLDEVGLLDEDYFIYSEEIDLCHRVKKADWKICWVPTAKVIHYGGQSTKQVAEKMFLHLYRSKVQFFRKNHGTFAARVYKLILVGASLGRLMFAPLARLQSTSKQRRHQHLSQNYRRLLLELSGM